MGPLGQMPQVIFCAFLCIFTNNIHVNVKNSSAEVVLLIELLSQVVQTETPFDLEWENLCMCNTITFLT